MDSDMGISLVSAPNSLNFSPIEPLYPPTLEDLRYQIKVSKTSGEVDDKT